MILTSKSYQGIRKLASIFLASCRTIKELRALLDNRFEMVFPFRNGIVQKGIQASLGKVPQIYIVKFATEDVQR
jgi:hypothetical protein